MRAWIMGWCVRCGKAFIVEASGEPRYCSETHKRRDAKDRRRARRKGAECEPYSRWRILERDDWRCQLCGEPIQRDAYYKDPNAATLDHMVPLSCGGADSPANLQTAHRACNCKRKASEQRIAP
jgi:5-methylcytosine-specific restriction endonuclease McrA